MNLFVIGWGSGRVPDPERARAAVRGFLARVPFLPGAEVREWRSPEGRMVAAWAADDKCYAEVSDDEAVLWAGRPVEWDEGRWTRVLGRDPGFAAVEDPLGAYPLYRTDVDGEVWLSNRAEPLRALTGSREVDRHALASLLGGGWPLGGQPVWAAVRRMTGPVAGGEAPAMCGAGWDAAKAAELLVENVRELAGWPGRPNVVPVTAGRDSRLVFAAALRAGIAFSAATGGAPDSPDVVGGRMLCDVAGVEHSLVPADPHGDPWSTPEEAARVLGLTTSGTASLGDAAGFPLGPVDGPPVLWHSGQGGEIARRYYRAAAGTDRNSAVDGLERVFCGRRPGRAEPLSPEGRASVRAGLERWVDGQLESGARVEDLPDLFYLDERMGSWAGATHGAVEWVRDTTSPLWSLRLLPHMLGGTVAEREAEAFHTAVLRELAPELADLPYEGGAASKRGVGHKVRRGIQEVRRRVARPDGRDGAPADPFDNVLRAVRRAAAAHPDHVAWQVLDRPRAEALIARPASALDDMNRHYVWRIATVLLDPAMAEAEA